MQANPQITYLKKTLAFAFIIIGMFQSVAQDYPYDIPKYDFVKYNTNTLDFYGDSSLFDTLFNSFKELVLKGNQHINIVHIGDSHIQADFFSGRVRTRLQTFFQGGIGSRGFIFPYDVAATNNPNDYEVCFTGDWERCRNIETTKHCELGLSGISVTTTDSIAVISIKLNEIKKPKYLFNKIKVFHSFNKDRLDLELNSYISKTEVRINDSLGYTMFILSDLVDSLQLQFSKKYKYQNSFTLHGISLESDGPGITYHAIGINGAQVSSYLRCSLLSEHLEALEPNLIIVSLGANDTYIKHFRDDIFRRNLSTLIKKIQKASPNVPIILMTPSDDYFLHKTLNPFPELAGQRIVEVAEEYNCAVWDFFDIMGGLNSITLWQKNELARTDFIHLMQEGYKLQGDLLFNAIIKSYDNYIDRTRIETQLKKK